MDFLFLPATDAQAKQETPCRDGRGRPDGSTKPGNDPRVCVCVCAFDSLGPVVMSSCACDCLRLALVKLVHLSVSAFPFHSLRFPLLQDGKAGCHLGPGFFPEAFRLLQFRLQRHVKRMQLPEQPEVTDNPCDPCIVLGARNPFIHANKEPMLETTAIRLYNKLSVPPLPNSCSCLSPPLTSSPYFPLLLVPSPSQADPSPNLPSLISPSCLSSVPLQAVSFPYLPSLIPFLACPLSLQAV